MRPTTTRPSPSRSHATLASALAISLLAAACSSDDDDGGGTTPPPPNASTAFTSALARAQTTNNATLGTALRVTVRNRAPESGTFQTPVWVGFHDGTFDAFDVGSAASAELERLAEDGDPDPLAQSFDMAGGTSTGGTLGGVLGPESGPIAPSESTSRVFRVDPAAAESRYMSFASMVIPSNDAFIGNDDPMSTEVFDANGVFQPVSVTVLGTEVLDAGTEVNDESPMNTAFFGQTTPNTGTTEGGVVAPHPGFLAAGMGGILDDVMFAGADFANIPNYEMITIEVSEVTSVAEPVGDAVVTLDVGAMEITFQLVATNLSGDVTVAHLHNAPAGMAGPVEIDLGPYFQVNGDGDFRAAGTAPVTADQVAAMRAGMLYFNVHTSLNPNGEVRGQVVANDAATAILDDLSVTSPPTVGAELRVTVQNLAPEMGTFQTPVWVGLHNGSFDTFDLGSPASAELESLAEDGDADPLGMSFDASTAGAVGDVIGSNNGPFAPGDTASTYLRIDPTLTTNQYFSFASMIIPSNDAFLANDDPMGIRLFDGGGNLLVQELTVDATEALDAGTEMNDEIPTNTAFFGQTVPGTGTPEIANVMAHPGFLAAGMGGILDDPMFANADFANTVGYEFLGFDFGLDAPTTPPASGVASIRFISATTAVVDVGVIGLSGPATSVSLRNASAGSDGPLLRDLQSAAVSTGGGGLQVRNETIAVDQAFRDALSAGEVYLEVATNLNPGGEVRGQLATAP